MSVIAELVERHYTQDKLSRIAGEVLRSGRLQTACIIRIDASGNKESRYVPYTNQMGHHYAGDRGTAGAAQRDRTGRMGGWRQRLALASE